MIKKETISRVLDAAEIVEVIGDFVPLKRRGANYIACCPFHSEKTPSFSVSPAKGIFKCFGCGKGGNAVTFVMEHEKLGYVEAIKYLGRKYNIEVKEEEETPEEVQERLRSESILAVNQYGAEFFKKSLFESDQGRSIALSYLKKRGIESEIIDKFELGWAPYGYNSLTESAINSGYKEEFLIAAGLTYKRDDGSLVDRFAERVIFPIQSISGRVIAFGGRTLKEEKRIAKYINSPETEVYNKSRSLYGVFQAKNAIVREDKCYIVEGYTDVLSLHQAGVENVVASSGTALTIEQIRLIKRFTKKITLLFDGDSAGVTASLRAIDMILEEGMEVRVALFKEGDDPDTYARSHGGEALKSFIEREEKDFISFRKSLYEREGDSDPSKRAKLISDSVASIALIPEAINRTVYSEELSRQLDIAKETILDEVQRARGKKRPRTPSRRPVVAARPVVDTGDQLPSFITGTYCEPAEKELLYYLIKYGEHEIFLGEEDPVTVSQLILDELNSDDLEFNNLLYKKIFDHYYTVRELDQEAIQKEFINHPDSEIVKIISDILHREEPLTVKVFAESVTPEEMTLQDAVPKSILVYKAKITAMAYQDVCEKLSEAEKSEDKGLLQELLERAQVLMRVRHSLSKKLQRLTL